MAKGEYVELNCLAPPYGTGDPSNDYSCSGINPTTGQPIYFNACRGFINPYEKCNAAGYISTTMVVNDDYSITFTGTVPATSTVYTDDWYTCEGWLNPAYIATPVTTPDISQIKIWIFCDYGSGVEYTIALDNTITLTDPGDIAVTGGVWTYTTDPCQLNAYGRYIIRVTYSFDYASSPVTANSFGDWCDMPVDSLFVQQPDGRLPIGIEYLLGGFSGSYTVIGGTLLPYDTSAGCLLYPAPRTKGGPKKNKIR